MKRSFKLGLPQPKPSARLVLELKAPAVSVGSADDTAGTHTLVRDVDVVLERGEKVALLGPNGSGKTTLIETVAGLRSLADGASHLGHNVRPAYYSQQGRELREQDTVLQTVLPLVGQEEQAARGLLGRFQFGPDEVEKRVEMLSGGERSRLRLLTLLVGDANFLLLDEPTNHLDMGSVEALADALEDYTGTILLVTHDRHLIDRVATRVLEISDGHLLNHLSATRYWEARNERLGIEPAPAAPAAREGKRAGKAAPAGAAATRGKESAEESRRRRARLRGAEAAILRAEKRLGEIDAELAEPDTYADRDVLNRLLDERGIVEAQLQREYASLGEARRRAGLTARPPGFCWAVDPMALPGERRMSPCWRLLPPSRAARARAAAAAARVVRRQPARPAVAPHHRPLRHPRQRDHAAADAGASRRAALRRVARGVADAREPRRGAAGRRAAALAGPRLQQPGAAPAGVRGGGRRRARADDRPAELPRTLDGLRALPGIGPYTARAVLVFAHNDDLAAVDANVRRVLTHEPDCPTTSPTPDSRRWRTPCCRAATAGTGTTRSWTTGPWC